MQVKAPDCEEYIQVPLFKHGGLAEFKQGLDCLVA